MTAHTLHGLISLIENISSYRSDKPTDEQKTEACDYAAALAGQAPKVPALNTRQRALLRFALWLFINDARRKANEAAQDKGGKYWGAGAVAELLKDAEDAEELRAMFTSGTLPAAPLSAEPANKEQTE
jgi:hypothetical protein